MQKICIVIPCYNEESRFPLNEFEQSFSAIKYYFVFVNDGSSDNTIELLHRFRKNKENRIVILNLSKNVGKAEAVRKGMLYAKKWQKFNIVGYMDSDLAAPISEVNNLTKFLNDEILFTFGSRIRRVGAEIQRKWYRHIMGRFFATIASNLLKLDVYDTQCGLKFFDSRLINPIFEKKFISNWIFDLEIFFRLFQLNKNNSINNIAKEIPVEKWIDIGGSKIKFIHLLLIPYELLKIHKHYKKIQN